MPTNLTTSSAIYAFMDETTEAGMRAAIGLPITTQQWTTITFNGAFTAAFTLTGNTAVTFPTTGTLVTTSSKLSAFAATTSAELAGVISNETGSGSLVFATSPTLVTPVLGAATATSINGLTITSSTGVLTITNGKTVSFSNTMAFVGTDSKTYTFPTTDATIARTDAAQTFTGVQTFTAPVMSTPTLGTPASGTLTNCTGLPVSTGISGLGSGVATFLATASSANLRAAVSDETGSGALVFATTPTLVTPEIGAATGTSLTLSGALTSPTIGTAGSTAYTGATLALTGAATISAGAVTATGLTISASGIRHSMVTHSSDGAISTTSGIAIITKAGVAAMTVAAPSSIDGQELTIINGSNNAHVITFTGSTLYDGTTGANLTATFTAFIGACITVIASGSTWLTKSYHATTIAP